MSPRYFGPRPGLPWETKGQSFAAWWETSLGFEWGARSFTHSLVHWVNHGLLTVFFFVVGLEIKREFTVGHLATLREFIAACDLATPPFVITEDVHRSCHTLSGTAKTAGARQGIKIAEPLNRYIRKLYDNSIGMPAAGLAVLKDASAALTARTAPRPPMMVPTPDTTGWICLMRAMSSSDEPARIARGAAMGFSPRNV